MAYPLSTSRHLRPTSTLAALAVALTAAACGGAWPGEAPGDWDDAPALAHGHAAIVNGAEDKGHPSVGRLSSGAESLCTATLIGPSTVLTAAHCVTKKGPGYPLFPVLFSMGSFLTPYNATKVTIHPKYGSYYHEYDIAVLRLDQPVQGVVPSRISSTVPKVGQKVSLVGFGLTSSSDWGSGGTKRIGQNTIAQVSEREISFSATPTQGANLCSGDSGGPTFALENGKEILIGVHSTGSAPCGYSGNDARVDAFKDWILSVSDGDVTDKLDETAPTVTILSPADGARVGMKFSVKARATDAVGVVGVEAELDGMAAFPVSKPPYDFDFESRATGKMTVTVVARDAAGNKGQAQVSVTVEAPRAKASFGEACTRNDDCFSNLCIANPANGALFCSGVCDPAQDTCQGDYTCQSSDGKNVCLPAPSATDPTDPSAEGGGCNVSGSAPLPLPCLLLLAVARLRRTRRPR